jgi:hypothetical protein
MFDGDADGEGAKVGRSVEDRWKVGAGRSVDLMAQIRTGALDH